MNKIIKSILILSGSVLALNAFAATGITKFMTIAQAQQHCPSLTNLTFTPLNKTINHSKGTITGNKDNDNFANVINDPGVSRYVMQPLYIQNNKITDASWRKVMGSYGYISNGVTTCLYSYKGFTGVNVALIMRGK